MKLVYKLNLEDDNIVIFTDALGFSETIMSNENINGDEHDVLIGDFQGFYERFYTYYGTNEYYNHTGIRFTWVSDSIFMSSKLTSANKLFEEFAEIYRQFAAYGFLLRGGISIGKNFHKNNVWGPATINAVKLESQLAIYPRVIINDEDYSKMTLNKSIKQAFKKDFDGFVYFDVLDYLIREKNCNYPFIKFYVEDIANGISNNSNLKIKAKYEWVKHKIIQCLNEHTSIVQSIIDTDQMDKSFPEQYKDVQALIDKLNN